MTHEMIKFLIILHGFSFCTTTSEKISTSVRFQWNYLNFTWPNQDAYNTALRDKSYVLENNSISGIKLWKNDVYLTVPRWKRGVPATLVKTSLNTTEISPLLVPYPNWEMNKLDDCSSFQFVLSMEIDPVGRLWAIDNGRSEIFTSEPLVNCPPRLVILDLENNGRILINYVFPDDVAHSGTTFLNDIVLDHENGGMAYITDTDASDPGVIVFSLDEMISCKVRHDTMKANAEAFELVVNGTRLLNKSPINGIALSPASVTENRLIYYTALSSYEIFTIPTSILKKKTMAINNYSDYVQSLGKKESQSDGIVMSANEVLYCGLLSKDAVGMWDTKSLPFSENQKILTEDHDTMQWPNSFAFDDKSKIWFITNKMQKFITNSVNMSVPNYRVMNAEVSSNSYQYFTNGSHPEIPIIKI